MMTDYTPIDCGRYSEYEVAIMHRQRLRVSWREPEGESHVEVLLPKDLCTRDGEEFLIAQGAGGQRLELRLDYIQRAEAL